jgi:hypothetical protein
LLNFNSLCSGEQTPTVRTRHDVAAKREIVDGANDRNRRCDARESVPNGLESRKKSRIVIRPFAGNPDRVSAEAILMLTNSLNDAPQAWMRRAERARGIAVMLGRKDAEAIEAYARECETRARQVIERPAVASLAA